MYDSDFHFYNDELKAWWKTEDKIWNQFIYWVWRFVKHPNVEAIERDFSLKV